jgi:AraC-like DNA-binding protein
MDPSLGASQLRQRVRAPSHAEIKAWYAHARGARDLALRGIGVRERMAPGVVDRPQGTGDWLLAAFHQPVTLAAGGAPTAGPCLVLWAPGQAQWFGREDSAWTHSWAHLDGACLRRHAAASGLPRGEAIAPIDPALVDRCLSDIHHEAQAHAESDLVIIENLLHNLLRQVARSSRGARRAAPAEFLAVRRHLEAAFAERIALADLAELAGCSVGHFCAGFKRWFGVSAIDYLITLRMQRARVLLGDRNLTVGEVARAVGYEDLHHFSKLYRKRHGQAPSAARGRA